MAQVRQELGPDALIVTRRQLQSGRDPQQPGEVVEITAISAQDAQSRGFESGQTGFPEMMQRRLQRGGVPEWAARNLAIRVRTQLERFRGGSDAELRALSSALSQQVRFAPGVEEGGRVAIMVGPTGAGKTTTLAKLGARAALLQRRKTAMVCLDQYRIGSVEQLQRYAELIGVPMEAAHDGPSLADAVARLGDAELVLVDTAGRSPRDAGALEQLRDQFLAVAEPVDIYLCLPVATRSQELESLLQHQSLLKPTRLIATKADEAICGSGAIAAQMRSGLPLSYVTTGQRVPEDIEDGNPELLALLLSGEELPQS